MSLKQNLLWFRVAILVLSAMLVACGGSPSGAGSDGSTSTPQPNTSVALPTVSSVTPQIAMIGVTTVFSVTGTNLPLTAALSVQGASCLAPTGNTATGFSQNCTLGGTAGAKTATVLTAPGKSIIDASRSISAVSSTPSTITECDPINKNASKALAVLVTFCSDVSTSACPNQVVPVYDRAGFIDSMWNKTYSVAGLFSFSSYGKKTLAPEGAFDHCSKVLEVKIKVTPDINNFWDKYAAEDLAKAAVMTKYSINTGVAVGAPGGYDHAMFVFPTLMNNFAEAGGNYSYFYSVSLDGLAHELGHTLGFTHSNSLINEEGTPLAYQDTSSPMGYSVGCCLRGFNAIESDQKGWVATDLITDPFADGTKNKTLTLVPLEFQPTEFNHTAGFQIARFQQANQASADSKYYLSVRTDKDPSGKILAYQWFGDPKYRGVNIHLTKKTVPTDRPQSNYVASLTTVGSTHTLKDGTTIKLTAINATLQSYTVQVSRP